MILKSYNDGLNPKQIMKKVFTVNGRHIFSWSVIEREINRMIEDGCDVKMHFKETIEKWEPKDFELEKSTTWKFRKRGDWATHNGNYRGNWPPEIPRNMILKYTNLGDMVMDCFLGGGTTILESRLLGRNALGFDVNPFSISLTDAQLEIINKEATRQGINLPESEIKTEVADARILSSVKDNSIDLICTHPPYFKTLRYTRDVEGDLSKITKIDNFLTEMEKVAQQCYRTLKPGKHCAFLIGDIRINNNMYPLGFKLMETFLQAGFQLEDIILKEQFNDRSTAFYVSHKFLRISHEYLFVLQKPLCAASISKVRKKRKTPDPV